jgi:hypothetical protein
MSFTVADAIEALQRLDPTLELWVESPNSADGFSRALAIGPGSDPDPAPGEPSRFAVVTVTD